MTQRVILLISVCIALVIVIAAGTWLVLNPNSIFAANRGQSMPTTDQVRGSIQCQTPITTACSVTITNDAVSHNTYDWQLVSLAPAATRSSSSSGTLSPGATANIQVTYPDAIMHICPIMLTFSMRPESSTSSHSLVLTWRCS